MAFCHNSSFNKSFRPSELTSLDEAKALLMSLCEEGNEWILDKLNK